MKKVYQGLWYGLLFMQCMVNTSDRQNGVYDALGYKVSDNRQHITITAPHIFMNPKEIPEHHTFQKCTIQLHSVSDALDVEPILQHMLNLNALYIINMPIKEIKFPEKSRYASIKQLEISDTKTITIACNTICAVFPELKSLIIKNNSTLERLIYPESYHGHLEQIDLSGNGLTKINLNKLLLLSAKLERLILSSNPLAYIEWVPDDFVAHYKVPEVVIKNVDIALQKKEVFLKSAATDNKIYIWMKQFLPLAIALSFAARGFNDSKKNFTMNLFMNSLGISIGYLVGRLVVDKVLFPKPDDRRLPYFKAVFE